VTDLVSWKWVSDKYGENYCNAILHLAEQKFFKMWSHV